jgi:hypothetical protein
MTLKVIPTFLSYDHIDQNSSNPQILSFKGINLFNYIYLLSNKLKNIHEKANLFTILPFAANCELL